MWLQLSLKRIQEQGHIKETSSTTGHYCEGVFKVTNMAGVSGEKSGTQPQFKSDSRKITTTIRLQDIYNPKPSQAPVRIRPPAPKPPFTKEQNVKHSISSDPPTKTIIRRRAQSLPSCSERKKELRRAQVRFVDALGLDLEEVKVFKVQEHPLIPQHVMFRLLMSSELAFGNSPELSLPYLKPCFPENMSTQPDFLDRLHSQSVSLEQVVCSEQGIAGTIQVLNLAYEKEVKVHYSFTNWRTHMDTAASWVSSGHHEKVDSPDKDVFRFHLPVPPFVLQPGAILEFAICYHVNGSDYWDNNNGNNYKLSCYSYKVTVPRECEGSMLHFT
ncbi:protein phosphatase 1, regulatory subunit 3Db [Melanotaenia boesemani]|uniref:protein phosphatase 1, regulatory subunit 3Db n=1 Tax=Melanotaenia boesemani TaxID=1250792 RepID=UPI001C058896|nr:protein phosphatase 1, regulatory subunit 3Db [Melanotaenia boesemani]